MNKVNWTVLGGAPIANEDWDFQDAGIRDAFKNFASFLGTDFYVSGGWDGTNYQTGIVCLGGEIYQITNSGVSGAYVYIEPNIVADPGGNRIFEDSSVPNIWEARTAQYNVYTMPQTGKVVANTLTNANTIINQMVNTFPHIFTKRQTFAKMDAALVGGGNNTIDISAANVVKCTLGSGAGTANLVGFTNGLENSTVYWCYASNVDVLVKSGSNISTPFSQDYLFKQGEWFSFVVVDGSYCLKTDKANKFYFKSNIAQTFAAFNPPGTTPNPYPMATFTTPNDGVYRKWELFCQVNVDASGSVEFTGVTSIGGTSLTFAFGRCIVSFVNTTGSPVTIAKMEQMGISPGGLGFAGYASMNCVLKYITDPLPPNTTIEVQLIPLEIFNGNLYINANGGIATMVEYDG